MCATALLASCLAPLAAGEGEQDDYEMFVTVDETKVSIISGNLTVAVTLDWPRMVFWHSVDPFSPTFDIGFPKLYLFNDTDGDGRFCRSEAGFTVYLDSNHVEWNVSSVSTGVASELGDYVEFSMSTQADAFNSTIDAPPSVESWANITFWFRLAENDTSYENPAGRHCVTGKTEMLVNMTLEVTNRTDFQDMAVERYLQGGGTTNMFQVLEDGPEGNVSAVLSGRDDESLDGDEFTRPLNGTASSIQSIRLAKDDGTVQAFYHWGSTATGTSVGEPSEIVVNSSCYTDGAGLVLHSALPLSNGTVAFSLDSSLGIVESGFAGKITDWLKEHVYAVMAAVAAAAVLLSAVSYLVLRSRRNKSERPADEELNKSP